MLVLQRCLLNHIKVFLLAADLAVRGRLGPRGAGGFIMPTLGQPPLWKKSV